MSHAYTIPGEGASIATIAITASIAVASAAGALAAAAPWLTSPPEQAEPAAILAASVPVLEPPAAPEAPAAAEPGAPPLDVPAPASPEPARACAPRLALVFPYASARVPAGAAAQLAPIVAYAGAHPDATVLVDGHADPSGDEVDNLVLSKRRANAVARLLRHGGLARERIVVRAFGAYVPVAGEAGAELRRVQVALTDDPCAGKESP